MIIEIITGKTLIAAIHILFGILVLAFPNFLRAGIGGLVLAFPNFLRFWIGIYLVLIGVLLLL